MKRYRLLLIVVLTCSLAGCSTVTETTTTAAAPDPGLLSVERTDSVPANATVVEDAFDRVNESSVLESVFEDARNESAPVAVELDGDDRERLDEDFEDVPYYDGKTTYGHFVEYESDVFRVEILVED